LNILPPRRTCIFIQFSHEQTNKQTRDKEGKSRHVRLELLNLARRVAVVSLLPALGIGAAALHGVVAEVHGAARLLRAQSAAGLGL
jgi:hypothetical protein